MIIKKSGALHGTLTVPGDKSISHRAVMFGAIAEGTTAVRGFLRSADCLATIDCFRKMGIDIEETAENGQAVLKVHGKGLHGLRRPDSALDAKNSGTTTRLLSGILAGQPFETTIVGDASLSRRPMGRVSDPLSRMGAVLETTDGHLPMTIRGGHLRGIAYESPVASAQVKSCVALAGLYADGRTTITEPYLSRNHTELLLRAFGADIHTEEGFLRSGREIDDLDGTFLRRAVPEEERPETAADPRGARAARQASYWNDPTPPSDRLRREKLYREMYGTDSLYGQQDPRPTCVVIPGRTLRAADITVPGDISSAAYFLAAANLVPGSELLLKNVGINPTRTGMLAALMAMGGKIEMENTRVESGEPVADLRVFHAPLKGTYIGGQLIPALIDELPVLAVLAAYAEGTTYIRDAAELRVKESDRISLVASLLRAMGTEVYELPDGMTIHGNGGRPFGSAVIDPHGDHRIAMAFAIAALASPDGITIRDEACAAVSYPSFFADLAAVGANINR